MHGCSVLFNLFIAKAFLTGPDELRMYECLIMNLYRFSDSSVISITKTASEKGGIQKRPSKTELSFDVCFIYNFNI